MNEADFMKQLEPIFRDERLITLNIMIRDLWMIDSAMSVAWRHPGLSAHQEEWIRHIHNQISEAIRQVHPEAEALLTAGWDTSMDVQANREIKRKLRRRYR